MPESKTPAQPTRDPRDRRVLVLGGVIVALVLAGMVSSVRLFGTTVATAQDGTASEGPPVTDGLDADLTVTSVDPVKSEMSIRLTLRPLGAFADNDGTLAKAVTLYFDSVDGTKQIDYKPGKPVGASDLSVPLLGDSVSRYPLDQTAGDVQFKFTTVGEAPAPGLAAAATADNGGGGGGGETPTTTAAPKPATPSVSDPIVPAQIAIFKNVPSYSVIEGAITAPDADGVLHAHFDVSRAPTAVFFSVLVTGIMWALALGVLFICLSVVLSRRKMEVGLLSMMGAVLFAMPAALRSSQPGIPPPGVLSDFYGFFWCDAIVALSLIVTILVYLWRRPA